MSRWLILSLGLGLVGLGAWALLTTPVPSAENIDDASRDQLERVLREAEGREGTR